MELTVVLGECSVTHKFSRKVLYMEFWQDPNERHIERSTLLPVDPPFLRCFGEGDGTLAVANSSPFSTTLRIADGFAALASASQVMQLIFRQRSISQSDRRKTSRTHHLPPRLNGKSLCLNMWSDCPSWVLPNLPPFNGDTSPRNPVHHPSCARKLIIHNWHTSTSSPYTRFARGTFL